MKIYTHNYTLPSEAENKIHEAYNKCQDPDVKHLLEDAQSLLRQYLAQDNLVPNNDIADGLMKQSEMFDDDQLGFIRDLFGEQLDGCNPDAESDDSIHEEELAIINVCQRQLNCPEYESVKQFINDDSGLWSEINEK